MPAVLTPAQNRLRQSVIWSFLLLLATVFLGGAYLLHVRGQSIQDAQFVQNGIRTTAYVTDSVDQTGYRTLPEWFIYYSYKDSSDGSFNGMGAFSSDIPIGSKIPVYYLSSNPAHSLPSDLIVPQSRVGFYAAGWCLAIIVFVLMLTSYYKKLNRSLAAKSGNVF